MYNVAIKYIEFAVCLQRFKASHFSSSSFELLQNCQKAFFPPLPLFLLKWPLQTGSDRSAFFFKKKAAKSKSGSLPLLNPQTHSLLAAQPLALPPYVGILHLAASLTRCQENGRSMLRPLPVRVYIPCTWRVCVRCEGRGSKLCPTGSNFSLQSAPSLPPSLHSL